MCPKHTGWWDINIDFLRAPRRSESRLLPPRAWSWHQGLLLKAYFSRRTVLRSVFCAEDFGWEHCLEPCDLWSEAHLATLFLLLSVGGARWRLGLLPGSSPLGARGVRQIIFKCGWLLLRLLEPLDDRVYGVAQKARVGNQGGQLLSYFSFFCFLWICVTEIITPV